MSKQLSARLVSAREAVGLRPEDVASALGVSYNTVRNYEKGRTTPSLGKLTEMAHLYRVPAGWLLDGEEG